MAATGIKIERNRRVRVWLIVGGALIALSITLRWPTFAVTVPSPSSPQILWPLLGIHACIWFLWFRWNPLRTRIAAIIVAVTWPVLDQGVVLFLRYPYASPPVEIPEFGASELGVWLGWWACWFIRPFAGVAEKTRRAFWWYAIFRALRQGTNWKGILLRVVPSVALSSVCLCLLPVLLRMVVVRVVGADQVYFPSIPTAGFVMLGVIGGLVGLLASAPIITRWLVMKRTTGYEESRPCFRCHSRCSEIQFDATGWGACADCGTPVHNGQWIAPPCVTSRSRAHRSRYQLSVLKAIAAGLPPLAAGYLLASHYASRADFFFIGFFPGLILLHISMLRVMRIELARLYDRQHIECRECAYDLKGASIEKGVGVCPECGTWFARMVEDERPKAQ